MPAPAYREYAKPVLYKLAAVRYRYQRRIVMVAGEKLIADRSSL
jgi:hypothetical protein